MVAAGKPKLIPGEWIRPGAVVIDVGISRLPNGKLSGDVDFATAKERAAYITPGGLACATDPRQQEGKNNRERERERERRRRRK